MAADFKLELVSIEVSNFKTFSGYLHGTDGNPHVIGPFTEFTGIVGPNGSGKSNIFDAIAFALNLDPRQKKWRAPTDFIHRPRPYYDAPEDNQKSRTNANPFLNESIANMSAISANQIGDFGKGCFVKLNMLKRSLSEPAKVEKFCVQRGVRVDESDVSGRAGKQYDFDYIINETTGPVPREHYDKFLEEWYHMNLIQDFMIWQGQLEAFCFGEKALLNLSTRFERLSGSLMHKAEYDSLKQSMSQSESQIRSLSDKLKQLRLEKIKLKGMLEFQRQIDDCIKQQTVAEATIVGLSILEAHALCEGIVENQNEIEQSIQRATGERSNLLQAVRQGEAELRRTENQFNEMSRDRKTLTFEVHKAQQEAIQRQRLVDEKRRVIQQKGIVLKQIENDEAGLQRERAALRQEIEKCNQEMDKIKKQMQKQPSLQEKEKQIDQYMKIRSGIQEQDARIEREKMKIQKELVQHQAKKDKLSQRLEHLLQQIHSIESQQRESQNLGEIEKQMGLRKTDLTRLKTQVQKSQQQVQSSKDSIKKVEALLLDKEFELREIENTKQIRASDAKLLQVLDELKRRCRGYLGQFYELVKPINKKYDLAVKVALAKCLKYLVVDTEATSRYLIDFLKEKGLQKDVLVLENLPQPSNDVDGVPAQRLRDMGGEYVKEVIETSRSNPQMQRAVDYFANNKVVCKDFQTAVDIKKKIGFKNLITLDGTEFKPGLVSGGQQNQNVFDLNLGQAELDRDIKRIQTQIQKLDEDLNKHTEALKEAKTSETKSVRELNICENEIMQLEQQLKQAKSKDGEMQARKKDIQVEQNEVQQAMKQVDVLFGKSQNEMSQLSKNLKDIEKQRFSDFCKQVGVKDITEFEKSTLGCSLNPGSSLSSNQEMDSQNSNIFELKAFIEHQIQKKTAKMEAIQQNSKEKQIELLKSSLEEDKKALQQLQDLDNQGGAQDASLGSSLDPLGNLIEKANSLVELKQKVEDLEKDMKEGEKKLVEKRVSQQKLKDQLLKQQQRIEALAKNQNLNRIDLSKIQNQIRQKIEEANLNRVFNIKEMGLHDNTDESGEKEEIDLQLIQDLQARIQNYENDSIQEITDKIKRFLYNTSLKQNLEQIDQLSVLNKIKSLSKEFRQKLECLQRQEEDFNQSVSVIVENDEQHVRMNQQIKDIKAQIDSITSTWEDQKSRFRDVKGQRRAKYLAYFDGVAATLTQVYKRLTDYSRLKSDNNFNITGAGTASISVMDRDTPFNEGGNGSVDANNQGALDSIIFEFKPSNKQFDFEQGARSGGEQAMAALALLFSMAIELRPEPPHLILLDEVDAHLDPDNAALLSLFINDWQSGRLNLQGGPRSPKVPQILMISHKNEMLSTTTSLIGVTNTDFELQQATSDEQRDLAKPDMANAQSVQMCSAITFSLDLQKYQPATTTATS